MSIMLETIAPPDNGLLTINLNLTARINISPDMARQEVNKFVKQPFVTSNPPQLVLRTEGFYWRVSLYHAHNLSDYIGAIDVQVETGELEVSQQLTQALNATLANHQNDVTRDPLFLITGYESDAPEDLATNHDIYLYGDNQP